MDIPITLGSAQSSREFEPLNMAVLVVEDNEVNRRVAEHLLDKFGCLHVSAGNGLEALQCTDSLYFDVILMDCQMPVMDGLKATHELRTRNYPCKIVAVTADGDRSKCMEAGMDDYLPKPLRANDLYAALSRASAC